VLRQPVGYASGDSGFSYPLIQIVNILVAAAGIEQQPPVAIFEMRPMPS
jgi:hypothetical protein